jgi:hypothetical protein
MAAAELRGEMFKAGFSQGSLYRAKHRMPEVSAEHGVWERALAGR